MPKVLISDALSPAAVQIFKDRGIEVDFQPNLGKDKEKLAEIIGIAQGNGASHEATIRQELADSYIGVQIMKFNGMRMLTDLVKKGVPLATGCSGRARERMP